MTKGRLEAFSDGVIAVIITIMVLELKTPIGHDLAAIEPLLPTLLIYVLSFLMVGIYWANHHHVFQAVEKVNGAVLWANMFLLFWLSLIPLLASWLGETWLSPWPVAIYGVDAIMAGIAYTFLVQALVRVPGQPSTLAAAIGKSYKDKLSILLYGLAIVVAFIFPAGSIALFLSVSAMWLIPDRRIERVIKAPGTD